MALHLPHLETHPGHIRPPPGKHIGHHCFALNYLKLFPQPPQASISRSMSRSRSSSLPRSMQRSSSRERAGSRSRSSRGSWGSSRGSLNSGSSAAVSAPPPATDAEVIVCFSDGATAGGGAAAAILHVPGRHTCHPGNVIASMACTVPTPQTLGGGRGKYKDSDDSHGPNNSGQQTGSGGVTLV